MTHHSQDVNFETMPNDSYNLSYTCFLLARDPEHDLTSSLSDQLEEWLQEICLAHGWKLEFVSVQPHYLQWAISVSPAVATVQIIQQVRAQTNQRIETATGKHTPYEFWAPGYLTLQGVHQNAGPLIERYIQLMNK